MAEQTLRCVKKINKRICQDNCALKNVELALSVTKEWCYFPKWIDSDLQFFLKIDLD